MITGLEQMNPDVRPELGLGYAGLRAKEIENRLVQHAKDGLIEFTPGPRTKNQLVELANGYIAMGKIPPLNTKPVDPKQKQLDDQAKQIAALMEQVAALSAPAAPPTPPESSFEAGQPSNVVRGPGRPKKA